MLGSDGMVGAPDAVFDVADRRVDPLEGGDLDGLGATAGDDWLVAAARLGDGAEAAEGVADHGGAGDQGAQAELFDLGLAEALDGVQLEAQRVMVVSTATTKGVLPAAPRPRLPPRRAPPR